MQRYVTVSEARQQFLKLVTETMEGDQIVVMKHGKPAVAMVEFERLQTIEWLAALWSDREAMIGMREATDDANAGRLIRVEGMPTLSRLREIARTHLAFLNGGRGSKTRLRHQRRRGNGSKAARLGKEN